VRRNSCGVNSRLHWTAVVRAAGQTAGMSPSAAENSLAATLVARCVADSPAIPFTNHPVTARQACFFRSVNPFRINWHGVAVI